MNQIQIGQSLIGNGQPCFLVAEIGINHNGDLNLAKETIDAAAEVGANAVKFQNYCTEDFISDRQLTYQYISQNQLTIESQYDLFKRCELKKDFLYELKAHCDRRGINFHSTPTSEAGLQDLVNLGVLLLKNGSDYLTHLPLIRRMGETGLPTVLSTGMATLAEIDDAVRTFRKTGNDHLILLHCTSSYPTSPEDVHLRKIPALAAVCGCLVGFSDHTQGIAAAIGAVALGACWVEKHFTLDKSLPGPDHYFSADPKEFQTLVDAIRNLEKSLGSSVITPTASETLGRHNFRLSCVAARDLPAGHYLTELDVVFRRPGTGLPPKAHIGLIGRQLRQDICNGHVFEAQDFV